MFLRPHHYQQYTRYIENLVEERGSVTRSFAWGYTELQLDQKMQGLGKISVSRCQGVFQDGTPFNMPGDDDPPLALEVPENTKQSIVYLCVPLRRSGMSDLDHKGDRDSLARYAPEEYETADNSTMGGGPAEIQVGKLRTRLMLEQEQRDDYACLGLGRIIEVRPDNSLLMDEDYLAPALDCQAVPGLARFIKELWSLLNHRADALASRVVVSGRGGAADIADFLLLQAVNRYLPIIAHLDSLRGYHPEAFYQLVASMAGELSTFTAPDKRAPEFPVYAHDKLQQSFRPVFDTLRQSLSMVLEQNAISIPLQERKYNIRVATVSDRSLLDQASFVLAVTAETPTEEIRQRFPAQVKIGSVEQIRQLVNAQLPGIRIRPLPIAPRQIPYHTGFVYFELERSGEFWDELKSSGGFAFHVGGQFPGLKIEFWAIRS
jgi:type VI secretion system protein ImpJ